MFSKPAYYPALFTAISFALGIWLQHQLEIPVVSWLGLFAVLVAVGLIFRRKQQAAFLFMALFFAAGGLHFSLWQQNSIRHPVAELLPMRDISAVVQVEEPPAPEKTYFIGRCSQVTAFGKTANINRHVQVRLNDPVSGLRPGDRLILKNVDFESLSSPRNPGQFDYRSYLQMRGVMAALVADRDSDIRILPSSTGFKANRVLFALRTSLAGRIQSLLPGQPARFLIAILLGEKQGISSDIKADFQNSGVAHVLAISGLHVGFVVLIIYLLLSFLPLSFRWHNLLTILLLTFYMLLTGANPPVVRATLMVSIYLIGQILERKPNVYNTVFAAAFLILLFQPRQLFWVGFQFSFVAVLSILYFYRQLQPLENRLAAALPAGPVRKWIHRGVMIPFLISLAAQLGTIPLMAVYFTKIPLVSFVLNLLVIPLVGFIVPLGIVVVAVSFLSFSMAAMMSELLFYTIRLLFELVHFAAHLPLAYIQLPAVPLLAVLVYFLTLWLLFHWKHPEVAAVRKPAVALSLIGVFWLLAPRSQHPEVMTLDVGQGEASVVRTPGGKLLLFDAGPAYHQRDSGKEVIFPALQYLGALHINKVFISHPHTDHIGGLFSLINLVSIDSVYLPDLKVSYFLQDSLLNVLSRKHIPYRLLGAGEIVPVDAGSKLYTLAPFPEYLNPPGTNGSQINNTSLVMLLKMKNASILFTGDAERTVENALSGWDSLLQADVLKLGHHGSSTSSTARFLSLISPHFGLIPVGRNNRYGHPAAVVLQRLQEMHIRYYRTDRQGAVWLRKRNKKWRAVEWR